MEVDSLTISIVAFVVFIVALMGFAYWRLSSARRKCEELFPGNSRRAKIERDYCKDRKGALAYDQIGTVSFLGFMGLDLLD